MLIAVDFDGTLSTGVYPAIGGLQDGARLNVYRLWLGGHRLILWTCREGEDLKAAVAALEDWGIDFCFEGYNENPEDRIARFGTDPRKLGADLYLDDKALGWPGWEGVELWIKEKGCTQ